MEIKKEEPADTDQEKGLVDIKVCRGRGGVSMMWKGTGEGDGKGALLKKVGRWRLREYKLLYVQETGETAEYL